MDEFTSHTIGQKFKMKFEASCKSSNIVYAIASKRCVASNMWARLDNRYIAGSMIIVSTLYSKGGLENPLWQNTSQAMGTLTDMVVAEVNQLYNSDPCLRKIWESRWIRKDPGDLTSFGNERQSRFTVKSAR